MAQPTSGPVRDQPTALPDPTERTSEQISSAIKSLKELLQQQNQALRQELYTRIDAIDMATKLFNENLTRVPTEVVKQIGHLKELHGSLIEERFSGVQKQFDERDIRAKASEDAAKVAVNAALQAQKEAAAAQNDSNAAAITKSESATTKQIDGILALLASNTKAIDEKITGINGRLDRGEGHSKGIGDGWGYVAGAIGLLLTFGALALSFLHKP